MPQLLSVRNLSIIYLGQNQNPKYALKDVSFDVNDAESLAVIGESGSGKSTLALAITNLLPSNAKIVSGDIMFHDVSGKLVNIAAQPCYSDEMRRLRGKGGISIVFQEPSSSLNQVYTVGWQLAERIQHAENRGDARELICTILREMGFADPERVYNSYPFQLSGGMNQRIMIAMALLGEPRLLVCDEPTSALDVTTQAQILRLLIELKVKHGFAMLFITHNVDVARFVATHVLVLYKGVMMEKGPAEEVLEQPLHPYTRYLKESVEAIKSAKKLLTSDTGHTKSSILSVSQGCPFALKCQYRLDLCIKEMPPQVDTDGRTLRCWLYQGV